MDPLTIAYLAIMAAGTGAQYMGAKKADNERAKAMAEERERRSKLTKQNEATAEQSKQIFSNVKQDEAARAGQIAEQISAKPYSATTSPNGQVRMLDPNSGPTATSVVGDPATTFDDVNKRLAARAQALGAANSFGSVFGDYGRALDRNAQDIDMNTTAMRNFANNVLPARLEYANQSGREWNTTGDVLKLVGTVMAPWALGGGAGAQTAGQQIGAARFGDASRLAQGFGAGGSIPFGSSFGTGALGAAGGMGAGIVADPRTQELLSLQRLGHRLSLADLEYLKTHNVPGMMH